MSTCDFWLIRQLDPVYDIQEFARGRGRREAQWARLRFKPNWIDTTNKLGRRFRRNLTDSEKEKER